jgi:hypothetical protein
MRYLSQSWRDSSSKTELPNLPFWLNNREGAKRMLTLCHCNHRAVLLHDWGDTSNEAEGLESKAEGCIGNPVTVKTVFSMRFWQFLTLVAIASTMLPAQCSRGSDGCRNIALNAPRRRRDRVPRPWYSEKCEAFPVCRGGYSHSIQILNDRQQFLNVSNECWPPS